MNRAILVASAVITISGSATILTATAAGAAPPEYPHGVGVCISQLAIDPSLVGLDRLGQGVRSLAGPGTADSDVPAAMDSARGDGPSGCGAPPGPDHLGG